MSIFRPHLIGLRRKPQVSGSASPQIRRPNAEGAASTWLVSGALSKTASVNEATADDDANYIYRTGSSGGTQRFTIPAFDFSSSSITHLKLIVRARVAAGAGNLLMRLIVGGTLYSAGNVALTSSYADYEATWATNPKSGAAWTLNDLNGIGANGLQDIDIRTSPSGADNQTRVTQMYVQVEFT